MRGGYADRLRSVLYRLHTEENAIIKEGLKKEMVSIIQAARSAGERVADLEREVSDLRGEQRYFWWIDKQPMTMGDVMKKETPFNPLGFELGCINQLGKCE